MNKIAINARCFSRRISGVERYAIEISKRLTPPVKIIQPKNPMGQIPGHLWEQFILPTRIGKDEVLWSPANTGPWSIQNQVITIHDASIFDHPEWFRPTFAAWTRLSWKILAKRAKAIITVSEFSRARLIYHLRGLENKINVVLNGVGKPFEPQAKYKIDEIRKKYNLSKPYFLFVATHEPGKNLRRLLCAFEKLNTSTHMLAIAGEKGMVFAESIDLFSNLTNAHFLGYVPDSDLAALYAGASAVMAPSLYEGFGLTVLEAMACGAPAISSNTTSIPEVAGNAALLVNPIHVEEIVNAMRKIIEDPHLAGILSERGLQRATQFTWDESARKTMNIICKPGKSHL